MSQTIKEWLKKVEKQLINANVYFGHGTDNAWDEAVQLVLFALKLPLNIGPEILEQTVDALEAAKIQALLDERIISRKPLPYLTHQAWFVGLPFYVDERVLIPRSPFGEWIERQFSPWILPENVKRIADLGTGSGCMAIIAALYFPNALVDAIDVSEDALKVAAINIRRFELQTRVKPIISDCFDHIPSDTRYDIIMSNPPYVGSEEMSTLPKEYEHEPKMALFADKNGLAIVDRILERAGDYLTPDGILIVEVGNSESAVIERYPHLPFIWLEMERGGHGVFLLTADDLRGNYVRK